MPPSATSRRGRGAAGRGDPGLAPTSLRRRAAALKGFYRFAYGEGLIAVDVAAHLDLPRPGRLLPETLTVDEIERLLEAAGGDDPEPNPTTPCATARCSSCSTRPDCGSARRSGSIREDLSVDGAFVRVIGKGDKERLVPVGDVALDWLGRWMAGPRPALLALGHVAPDRGGPLFLGDRGRRLARQQAWAAVKRAAARGRARRPGQPAHPPPLVRDPPARRRRRPAHRPGVARACEYLHDAALHASDRGADPGRLQSGPSAGLRGRHGPHELRRRVAVDGRADPPPHEAAPVHLRVGRPLGDPRRDHRRAVAWLATSISSGISGSIKSVLGWITLILFVGGIAVFVWTALRYLNQEYVLTNRRVIQVEGVSTGAPTDSSLEKINDAVLNQSIFGRMFDFGDLDVLTAVGERDRAIPDDPQPDRIQEADARRQARIRGRDGARGRWPRARRSATAPSPGSGRRRRPRPRPTPRGRRRSTLASLADLRDRGAISAEEYEAKKAELLDRL